jgi:hypothetical protein
VTGAGVLERPVRSDCSEPNGTTHAGAAASGEYPERPTGCRDGAESVPTRLAKHMMVVADLEKGNADAVKML